MGLIDLEPSVASILFSIVAGCLPSMLLPVRSNRFGVIVLWYIYLVTILPFWIMAKMLVDNEAILIAAISIWLPFIATVQLYRLFSKRNRDWLKKSKPDQSSIILASLCIFGGLIIMWKYSLTLTLGIDLDYSRRMAARGMIAEGSVLSYLMSNYIKVLVPIVISIGLASRSKTLSVLAGLFGSFVMFSFTGVKGTLLIPLVMIYVYYFSRRGALSFISLIIPIIIFLLLPIIMEGTSVEEFVNVYFNRRLFCSPQLVFHAYIEFFSENGFLYFSDLPGVWQLTGNTGRAVGASVQIGQEYFYDPNMNANTSATVYGFAEGGVIGAWLMALMVCIYIMIFERFTLGRDPRWVLPLSIPIAYVITEQALHTAILSGGLLGLLLFIFAYKRIRI